MVVNCSVQLWEEDVPQQYISRFVIQSTYLLMLLLYLANSQGNKSEECSGFAIYLTSLSCSFFFCMPNDRRARTKSRYIMPEIRIFSLTSSSWSQNEWLYVLDRSVLHHLYCFFSFWKFVLLEKHLAIFFR